MAPVKSMLIGDVILHNMIKKYESSCNIKPLFDIDLKVHTWNGGCFLKTIAKKLLRLKMQLFNIILEMTLWNIFGSKRQQHAPK
jgi:hypothetical protein